MLFLGVLYTLVTFFLFGVSYQLTIQARDTTERNVQTSAQSQHDILLQLTGYFTKTKGWLQRPNDCKAPSTLLYKCRQHEPRVTCFSELPMYKTETVLEHEDGTTSLTYSYNVSMASLEQFHELLRDSKDMAILEIITDVRHQNGDTETRDVGDALELLVPYEQLETVRMVVDLERLVGAADPSSYNWWVPGGSFAERRTERNRQEVRAWKSRLSFLAQERHLNLVFEQRDLRELDLGHNCTSQRHSAVSETQTHRLNGHFDSPDLWQKRHFQSC